MEPRVSVIIPVYNVERYLVECLDSVLGQSLKEIEVICVDDGSTDRSPEILHSYATRDQRLKVITQENKGVSRARNIGMKASTGRYVIFVDSDDYIEKMTAEKIWNAAEKNNADIVVFGGKSFPTVNWIDYRLTTRNTIYYDRSTEALMDEDGSRPFMCNKAYRRALLMEHGVEFYEELRLGEDHAFQFVVFPLARCIVYIEDRLYHYRQGRDESAMNRYSNDVSIRLKNHVKMLRYIYDSWQSSGLLQVEEIRFLNWAISYLYDDTNALCYDATVEVAEAVCSWMAGRDAAKLTPEVREKLYRLQCVIQEDHKEPEVTVIVPMYNADRFLQQCVESLLQQSFLNFQMIFIDDGSQDRSLEIIEQYQLADRRITLLRQEHEFAGAARNLGMKYARGKYLLFLDADDFFETDLLEKAVAQMNAYQADICVFKADTFDQRRGIHVPTPWTCNVNLVPQGEVFNRKSAPQNLFWFTTPAPWTKLFRRTFVEENSLDFQRVRSANDLKFIFSALAVADRIVVLDECLVHYRVNTGTSLQQTQDKDPMAFYNALMALKMELMERDVYHELEPAYKNFALDFCLYNLNTLKKRKSFEKLYFRLKEEIFEELELDREDAGYYYAYPSNCIFQKKEDIKQLGILEYVEKYGLFSEKQSECSDEVDILRREVWELRNSKSYRIGCLITAAPRKVRGGIRCLQENGLRYTIGRFREKLKDILQNDTGK